MEYFRLRYAVDTKETGNVYPQVVFKNPKKLDPNPVLLANKAINGAYPPENILPFDYLELNKGAKVSDLMSSHFENGFLFNKKVKAIFEGSHIEDFKFYDVKLFDKEKEIKDYYYFHSASNLKEFVDYSKSVFTACRLTRPMYDLPKTNTWEELNLLAKTLENGLSVRAKIFYLKNNFPFNLDFFMLKSYNYDFFITKRFKDKLEANQITGICIESVKDFIKTDNLS